MTSCQKVRATLMGMSQVVDAQVDSRTRSALVSVKKDEMKENVLSKTLKRKGFELKSIEKVTSE